MTFRKRGGTRAQVVITLSCGCKVKARAVPISGTVQMGCTSGLAHGYRMTWVKAVDGDKTFYNDKLPEQRKGEG